MPSKFFYINFINERKCMQLLWSYTLFHNSVLILIAKKNKSFKAVADCFSSFFVINIFVIFRLNGYGNEF